MHLHISDILPLIRETGAAVMDIYAQNVRGQRKADGSMVTEADKKANELLVAGLTQYGLPEKMPILSEEMGDNAERLSAERVWIIDPLDGTNDFLEKTDEFALMVGLVENGAPVMGAVYAPALDTLYYAQKGAGAWMEHAGETTKLVVSDRAEALRAVASRSHDAPEARALYAELGVAETIPTGSNGVKIGRIAEGRADIFCNPTHRMGEWDGCAPQIILEEAGGIMTGVGGAPITYNKKDPHLPHGILAANSAVHGRAVTAFRA